MKLKIYIADWCGASKMVKGALSRAKVECTYINIEEEPNEASEQGIQGVPTLILTEEDGTELRRFVGYSKENIERIKGELSDR